MQGSTHLKTMKKNGVYSCVLLLSSTRFLEMPLYRGMELSEGK